MCENFDLRIRWTLQKGEKIAFWEELEDYGDEGGVLGYSKQIFEGFL